MIVVENKSLINKVKEEFSKLQLQFSDIISDYKILSNKRVPEKYAEKVNVVVKLNELPILSVVSWILENKKPPISLWNNQEKRDTFWPLKLTRIIISLCWIDANGKIAIWINNGRTIVSVKMFYHYPLTLEYIERKNNDKSKS